MEHIAADAFEFLLACNVTSLPVDLEKVKIPGVSVVIRRYSEAPELLVGREKYAAKKKGFTRFRNGVYYILLSDNLSECERQAVIAHEYGHIWKKHFAKDGTLGKSDDPVVESEQEQEAIAFELPVRAPAPVLYRAGLTTPVQIQRATGINFQDAQIVARMVKAERRNRPTDITSRLGKAFRVFIVRNSLRHWRPALVICAVSLCCALAVGLSSRSAGGALPTTDAPLETATIETTTSITTAVSGLLSTTNSATEPEVLTTSAAATQPAVTTAPVATMQSTTTVKSTAAQTKASTTVAAAVPSEKPASQITMAETTTTPEVGKLYYWTQRGEVYHTHEDCQALKNAKYPIQSGALEEAQMYKDRLCSFCENRDN